MHHDLKSFIRKYLCVVCCALLPVIAVSFLSLPFNLDGTPGPAGDAVAARNYHLT